MDTKKCPRCGKNKTIECFHVKKGENRVNSWCKECVYERQRSRWIDRKIRAVEIFGSKCSICGYDKNLACLDFHHKDPLDKEFSWGQLKERRWDSIIEELKKCVLVCRNCHGEIHNPQLQKEKASYKGVDNRSLNGTFFQSTGECPICHKPVYGTKYCSQRCSSLSARKVSRPRKETLRKLIESKSWCEIGRDYGVSDNAVRKWARSYGLI